MKSLKESLFDDNITKDITFGDLYEFKSYNIVKIVHARGEYQDLSKSFSVGRIKKITRVSGSDKNETIYKGLVKIIQDIKLIGGPPSEMNVDWLKNKIEELVYNLFQYNLDTKIVYIGFYNKSALCLNKDYTLFDKGFDKIGISLGPDLTLVFKRK